MHCITRRPSALRGSQLSTRTGTAEATDVAEIETATEMAETAETVEMPEAEKGEEVEIEMPEEAHEAIHRQTSASSAAHLVIGLKTVQINGQEEGGADLEIETEMLIEEKDDASSAREKVIRQETAKRKEAEITEMAAMVEQEAIHQDTEGGAETEVIHETEGEEESTRDDPSLTTAETATTVAEPTRAEGRLSQDPHLEQRDTTTTRKDQQAAPNLREDIIAAEAETHQEAETTTAEAETRAPTSRSVAMSRSSQEMKEEPDLMLHLRALVAL